MALTKIPAYLSSTPSIVDGGNATALTIDSSENILIAGTLSDSGGLFATQAYVTTTINSLVDSAPGALNTLNELAAALGDDAAFSTTVTNSLALKAPLASPTFTGGITVGGNISNSSGSMDLNSVGTFTLDSGGHIILEGSDITLDAAGDVVIDAGGNQVWFQKNGTNALVIELDTTPEMSFYGGHLNFNNLAQDADISFNGFDGSTWTTALKLDLSEGGTAIFSNDIKVADDNNYYAGSSNELTIYHTGSGNSIISHSTSASGAMYIDAGGTLNIRNSTSGGENMITAVGDGAVTLYHNNIAKLATSTTGVTVTGYVDAVNSASLMGNFNSTHTDGPYIRFQEGGATEFFIGSSSSVGGGNANNYDLYAIAGKGMRFYTNSALSMTIESDGDVKVGPLAVASATSAPFHVAKASTDVQAIFGDNTSSIDDPSIRVIGRDTANSAIRYAFFGLDADANHGFIGYNHGAGGFVNALNFDTSGNVGIGITTPDQTLHVHKGSAGSVASSSDSVLTLENSGNAILQFLTPNANAAQIRFGDVADNGIGWFQYDHNTSKMQWGVNGPTRMTLDSSGNLGIGTPNPSNQLDVYSSSGWGTIDIDGASGGQLNFQRAGTQHLTIFANHSGSLASNIKAETDLYLAVANSATPLMSLKSNLRVGIGTTSPDALFTVDTNVGGASTGTIARFHASKGESDSTYLQISATRHSTATVQRAQLQAYDDDGSTVRFLTLNQAGGNVGVGTANPSSTKFHVHDNKGSAGEAWTAIGPGNMAAATITNESTANNTMAGLFFGTSSTPNIRGGMLMNFTNVANESTLHLATTDTSGNTRNRLTINGNGDIVIGATAKIYSSGDNDSYLQFNQANTLRAVIGDSTRMIIDTGCTTFNEDSHNYDFRVESDGNTHMLFVDAAENTVAIGNIPSYGGEKLVVDGPTSHASARWVNGWWEGNTAAWVGNTYVHIKSNLWGGGSPTGNTQFIMGGFHVKGYHYGGGNIHAVHQFHQWSGSLYNYNVADLGARTGDTHVYVSSDGWVTLRLKTGSYLMYIIDTVQYSLYGIRDFSLKSTTASSSATI